MRSQAEKQFWITVIAVLGAKILLAAALPITSDEAYFVIWAKNLDFGYYDHPPMIGWILYLFLTFGDSPLFLRLPAVFLSILIGISIFFLLAGKDEEKASLTAILFLIS